MLRLGGHKIGQTAARRIPRRRGRNHNAGYFMSEIKLEERVGAFRFSGCFQPVAWGHPSLLPCQRQVGTSCFG